MASASYSDIKINIKTSVDSSGIKEATKELNKLNAAQTAVAKGADKVSSKMDKVLKTTTSSRTSEVVNELPRSTSSQIVDTAKQTATHVRIIEKAAEEAQNDIRKTQDELRREAMLHDIGGLNGRAGARLGLLRNSGIDYVTGKYADLPHTIDPNESARDEVAYMFAEKQNSILGMDALGNMNFMSAAMARLGDAMSFVSKVGKGAVSAVGKFVSNVGERAAGRIKKFTKGILGVVNAFKRIAFYRFVRTVIKEITKGFREGVNNLYQWSKMADGEFAGSMDRIATSMLYMKNSLGAMVAPLINAIAPAIDFLIDKFVALLNVINRVFALVTGATSWTKAKKYPTEYAKAVSSGAGKAADALHKLGLAQIDQLTILDKNHGDTGGGGGGADALDYGSMFEKADFGDGIWKKIQDAIKNGDWRGAGRILAERLNEIVAGLDTYAWGKALGTKINNGLEFAYGFMKFTNFRLIGSKIAEFVNGGISAINFDTAGRLMARNLTALLDTILGFLGTLDWGAVGRSIRDYMVGYMNEMHDWFDSVDWDSVGRNLYNNTKSFIENIDFETLARTFFSLFGKALGSLAKALGGYFDEAWQDVKDYFKQKTDECGGDAVQGFLKGMKDAIKGVGQWVKTNIIDPFVKGFKDALGIHSPSTVMQSIGGDTLRGFFNGIKTAWQSIPSWIDQKVRELKNKFNFTWKLPEVKLPHIPTPHFTMATGIMGIQYPRFDGWWAQGGFPDSGSLFIARENGPEMVGSMGGRTAVANNDQIVAGISQGVYEAVRDAMGEGNQAVNVYLDGKQISGSVVKNINSETRRTGSSPLLSY